MKKTTYITQVSDNNKPKKSPAAPSKFQQKHNKSLHLNWNLSLFIIGLFVISCKPSSTNDQTITTDKPTNTSVISSTLSPKQLYGEWRNVSMVITTAYNTPTSTIEEYKEENWEKDLKIKPIRTYYNADGTYISEYRDLENVVFNTTSGIWTTKQDSVVLQQTKPEKRSAAYHVKFQGENEATFTALLDWTNNSKKDDLYVGKQQRMGE